MEANLATIREARRFVASTLREWGAEHLVETATLLVSELVTNAVLHAHTEVEVRVVEVAHTVRVEVGDLGGGKPVPHPPTEDSSAGRGLSLVAALATTWGVLPRPVGKVVWFELELA